jgi:neurotransmitter:Na+ symporter, NSS family
MKTITTVQRQEALARHKNVQFGRDSFTTGLGIIAATLGSAVGLGNIWRFPFLTGVNGGAAFIIVYLLCTLLVGLPIMISEIALGRWAKGNAVTTMVKLAPKNHPWWLIGAAGVLASFVFMGFYTVVVGWVFAYIFKAASGALLSTDPQQNAQAFSQLIADPVQSLAWQWGALLVAGSILACGVAKGIEKAAKWLMPALFLLLLVVAIRGLTLPGAVQGLLFLFQPDFSKVNGAMILTAMGLAFFKLSIGMGAMMTYGSYFRDDQNIPLTATKVMLGDLAVSMLAGIAIFPAVFTFGFQPDAGPGLLFITIPAVFASIPFGNIFVVIFFVLAAIAATGAMLSLLEVPVAFIHERFGLSRRTTTILVVALIALVGSAAALSNSLLADFKLDDKTMFDLYDFVTSNVLLPVVGLFISLFAGWAWGFSDMKQALSNTGTLRNDRFVYVFYGTVKLVTPVLVVIVLLNGLKLL